MWMNLTDATMSERGQIQRNMYCIILIQSSRMDTTSLLLEVRIAVTSTGGCMIMDWERPWGAGNVPDLDPGSGFLGEKSM